MSKICLMINNINELNIDVDAFIIGIKDFNNLNVLEITIEELKKINIDKEIYISLNKSIHDNEIESLKKILMELKNINISGILYDDISIYQICKEEKLNYNLIWSNIHQVTNYNTINTWYELGVGNAFISPDITLNEIIDIKKNSNSNLFVPIYGIFDIFTSNRFLLTNYLKYINIKKDDNDYFIENNDIKYPIYENSTGTHILNGNIINGLKESILLMDNNIEYLVINSYMINDVNNVTNKFNEVKKMYDNKNINYEKIEEYDKELGDNKGFLYEETIYKVKSDGNE